MSALYDTDFYAWTVQQRELLAQGRLQEVDIAHLMEELDDMSRSTKRELVNRLALLLMHLLKWRYQPRLQSISWQLTIEEQRLQVKELLLDNPSLHSLFPDILNRAYGQALLKAARETGLDKKEFPLVCPFTFDQILDNEFWP